MDTSLPLSSKEREALRESLQAYLTDLRPDGPSSSASASG
jgi:hypothetical protein